MLRGLPFLHQGQELGTTNKPFASIYEVDDVNTKGRIRRLRLAAGLRADDALEVIAHSQPRTTPAPPRSGPPRRTRGLPPASPGCRSTCGTGRSTPKPQLGRSCLGAEFLQKVDFFAKRPYV